MTFLSTAMFALRPAHNFRVINETELIWEDERPQPTQEEIDAKLAELQAAEPMRLLRIERNKLLAQSDWRMVADYPGTNQTEWQTYRQALRDITTQTPSLDVDGNLTGITWPTPPTD